MGPKTHVEVIQSPAAIGRQVGSEFSTFGDWALSTTIVLILNKKIVQKWRGAD